MVSFTTIGDWLRDGFLPAIVIVLGALLVARFASWIASRSEGAIEERIRQAIDDGDIASERSKHARAVRGIANRSALARAVAAFAASARSPRCQARQSRRAATRDVRSDSAKTCVIVDPGMGATGA